ncbi:MAG: hypothetical protein DHS20C17_00040 [Cyclobacteriaceae bacterium]|nr:MAG: hypothetical protein DHS20C17_00040 [Cyclobacteriaceae bacterium]
MRLSKTLKYLIILFVVLLTAVPYQVSADANPENTGKTEAREENEEEQMYQKDSETEQKDQVTDNGKVKDKERADISKSSFNYFFYLIYKIKFEDVFRFPQRGNTQNSIGIKVMDINSLLDHLVRPKI